MERGSNEAEGERGREEGRRRTKEEDFFFSPQGQHAACIHFLPRLKKSFVFPLAPFFTVSFVLCSFFSAILCNRA